MIDWNKIKVNNNIKPYVNPSEKPQKLVGRSTFIQPKITLTSNSPITLKKPVVVPAPNKNMPTYVQEFQKGNLGSGLGNLALSTVTAGQDALRSASANIASLATGKGVVPYKANVTKQSYEDQVAKLTGGVPIYKQIAKVSPALSKSYLTVGEIVEDPLSLFDAAAVLTVKGLKIAGSAEYVKELLKIKPIKLMSGKTATKIEDLTQPEIEKIAKTAKDKNASTINNVIQPKGTQTIPQAPTNTVQPVNPNLGTNIPKEQMFSINANITKPILKRVEQARGFSNNIASDKAMNENLQKFYAETPDTYKTLSNAETLGKANKILNSTGINESYDTVMKAIASNDLKPEHIPLARKVANQLAKDGDIEGAKRILSDISVKLTESGQLSQAANILKNSDPMAVLQFIEKTLKKTNDELAKRIKGFEGLKLTDEEIQRIANIDVGDVEAIKQAVSDVGKRLAKEIPSTLFEKFDELRRIAMLGNFKTQVRNVVGNIPLALERKLSNKTSAIIQKALPKEQRTQALFSTKESKILAKQLYGIDKELLFSSNKWDTNDIRKVLGEEREVFNKSVVGRVAKKLGASEKIQSIANNAGLEGTRKLVYGSLQLGDAPFLKSAYVDRIASYISAQGYKTLDEIPQKALDIAKEEALKATFRDSNAAARFINNVKREGGAIGKLTEATLPFVTTPTNLIRRAIDYSPIGLIRSLTRMKKMNDIPKVIDEMAQGLTGTALLGIGTFLASSGIIIGRADTNKNKANYEKTTGKLPFSIQTSQGTITYDWAQPFGSQLSVAAEMYKAYSKSMQETGKFTAIDLTNALLQSGYAAIDVTLQASVYQNVLDLFSGYGSVGERITQNASDYPLQAIPTMFGQLARSGDLYVRNAYDKTNKISSYKNTIFAKLPGASETLPIKYDVWGRPVKRAENSTARTAQEFLNPANVLAKNQTPLDKEILSLYDKTGSNDVFPRTAPYSFSASGTVYSLNNKDISDYQKNMGQYAEKEVNKLINSGGYKTMGDGEKIKALNDVYTDASQSAKMQYLEGKDLSPLLVFDKSQIQNYNTKVKKLGVTPVQYRDAYLSQKEPLSNIGKAIALKAAGYSNLTSAFDISTESTKIANALSQTGLAKQYNSTYETLKGFTGSEVKKRMIDKANPELSYNQLVILYEAFDISQGVGRYERQFN